MERERIQRYVANTLGGGMTCREFVELVTDYLEGTLPFTRWVRFHVHLGFCRGCRHYLSQMRDTIHRLGMLSLEPPSETVRRELQQRFRDWAASRAAG